MSIIPVLERLRKEDGKLKAGLGYITRSCLKNKTKPFTFVYITQLK
jgi:hypothetical protein